MNFIHLASRRVGETSQRVGKSGSWRVGESPESPGPKSCTVNFQFLSQNKDIFWDTHMASPRDEMVSRRVRETRWRVGIKKDWKFLKKFSKIFKIFLKKWWQVGESASQRVHETRWRVGESASRDLKKIWKFFKIFQKILKNLAFNRGYPFAFRWSTDAFFATKNCHF